MSRNENFVYLDAHVKPSIKHKTYSDALNIFADVYGVACSCPAGTGNNFYNEIMVAILLVQFVW